MKHRAEANEISRRTMLSTAPLAIAAVAGFPVASRSQEPDMNPFDELIRISQAEKKGLTFYVGGQTIAGIVTKINAGQTVEVRNQTHSRVLIRLDRVDAVALA